MCANFELDCPLVRNEHAKMAPVLLSPSRGGDFHPVAIRSIWYAPHFFEKFRYWSGQPFRIVVPLLCLRCSGMGMPHKERVYTPCI